MPELPDVALYVEAVAKRIVGARLEHVRLLTPFILRSVSPAARELEGRRALGVERLGKRIVLGFEDELFAVIHLMIAGRLHWRAADSKPGRRGKPLAVFAFETGELELTEAGSKRRAALHFVRGRSALAAHDPGGIEPLACTLESFATALRAENHTLKRSLTDPRAFSGIGNAYSDEILHRARLSPVSLSQKLRDPDVERLYLATREVLAEWLDRLRAEAGDAFPANVTAFRPEMAVHGRWKKPCPVCAAPVQRIVHAENETNYCARCQTGGKLLADRALSRLLKADWPKTLEELEALRRS